MDVKVVVPTPILQQIWSRNTKLESHYNKINQFPIQGVDLKVSEVFKVIFNNFNIFELIKMTGVCKTFFIIGRELMTPKIPDFIAERLNVERQLKERSLDPSNTRLCLSLPDYL